MLRQLGQQERRKISEGMIAGCEARHSRVWQLSVLLGLLPAIGCAAMRLPLVKDTAREGRIEGIYAKSPMAWVFPEFAEGRRYSKVELLQNVEFGTTPEDSKLCSFVLGRRRSDGHWEIVSAAARDDEGAWHELEVQPDE